VGDFVMEDISYYIEQWYEHKSFPVLYKAFRKSSGITRTVLSRMVASRIVEESLFNDSVVVDEILDNCGLETIWYLASGTQNDFLKAKCMERLERFIENDQNVELEKEKMSLDMIETVFGEIRDKSEVIEEEERDIYGKYKRR